MSEDVISVDEVARILKKSVSWAYSNAAQLGASMIGRSLIFRRSTLEVALENAKLKPKAIRNETEKPADILRLRRKKNLHHPTFSQSTDPSKYGLADMFSFGGLSWTALASQGVFDDVDVMGALAALRGAKMSGGENAVL